MSNQLTHWQKMWQSAHSIGVTDRQRVLQNTGTHVNMYTQMMDDIQSRMMVNSSVPLCSMVQFAADEIATYITQTVPGMTYDSVNVSIDCLKLVNKIDCLALQTHKQHMLHEFECTYGPFRWLMLNDVEKFKVPILRVWASVFALVWTLARAPAISDADMHAIGVDIMHITGQFELKLFACICMYFHRMFGVLPYRVCRIFERFI